MISRDRANMLMLLSIGIQPMQKPLRTAVTAIVSGLVFFFGAIFVLLEIGLARYDNYEYYGQYPALYVVPGLFGLIMPSLISWMVRKTGTAGNGDPTEENSLSVR